MSTLYVPFMAGMWNMTPAEYWLDCARKREAEGNLVEAAWCKQRAEQEGGPKLDRKTRKLAEERPW